MAIDTNKPRTSTNPPSGRTPSSPSPSSGGDKAGNTTPSPTRDSGSPTPPAGVTRSGSDTGNTGTTPDSQGAPSRPKDVTSVSKEAREQLDTRMDLAENLHNNYDLAKGLDQDEDDDGDVTASDLNGLAAKPGDENYIEDATLDERIRDENEGISDAEVAAKRKELRQLGRGYSNDPEAIDALDTADDGGDTDGKISTGDVDKYQEKLEATSDVIGENGEGLTHANRLNNNFDVISGGDTIHQDDFDNFKDISNNDLKSRLLQNGYSEDKVNDSKWLDKKRDAINRSVDYVNSNDAFRTALDNGADDDKDLLSDSGDDKFALQDAQGLKTSLDDLLGSRQPRATGDRANEDRAPQGRTRNDDRGNAGNQTRLPDAYKKAGYKNAKQYEIEGGDNLTSVLRQAGWSDEQINNKNLIDLVAKQNKIADPNLIYSGDQYYVPAPVENPPAQREPERDQSDEPAGPPAPMGPPTPPNLSPAFQPIGSQPLFPGYTNQLQPLDQLQAAG